MSAEKPKPSLLQGSLDMLILRTLTRVRITDTPLPSICTR